MEQRKLALIKRDGLGMCDLPSSALQQKQARMRVGRRRTLPASHLQSAACMACQRQESSIQLALKTIV